MFKVSLIIVCFLPLLLLAQEKERTDISDTSIIKNYFDIESYNDNELILTGWDYDGGGIYTYNLQNENKRYFKLFEDKDINLFSLKVLDLDSNTADDDILLAAGYYSKCLCGVLLRGNKNSGQLQQIFFDDIDNPYTGNIFDISVNANDENLTDFNRVFLACANGIVYYSEDNAVTFRKASIDAGNDLIRKIVFETNYFGYAISGSEQYFLTKLYKTIDGGLHWFLVKDFAEENLILNDIYIVGNKLLLCGSQFTKGILLLSNDKCETFKFLKYNNSNLFPKALVALSSENENIYAIDESGVVYYSAGGDSDFQKLTDSEEIGVFKAAASNNEFLIFCGKNGKVIKIGK